MNYQEYVLREDNLVEEINQLIIDAKREVKGFRENDISDGYHTFEELYEFRKVYHALLFNEWARDRWKYKSIFTPDDPVRSTYIRYNVHKSWRHHDGELCFGGGWFIVVAMLPDGQISNHYKAKDWDLFKIPETEKALFEFDGHTGKDVLERMYKLIDP